MSDAGVFLERVRLHGDALDPALARQRLGSLLAGAELRPPGLPPSAVLCVRRVVDPLPGALRLERPETRPPPEWERALVATLEHALRGAARPAHGPVPAAAGAVLFADRAELLACLARDARDGTAWLRWWWRGLRLLPSGGGDPAVAAWLETPEHVPAALELLARRGDAVRFVAALSAGDATSLVLRVAAAYGLPELRRVAAAPAAPPAPREQGPPAGAAPPSQPEPPWRALVPETAERPLEPAAELLLGAGLALRRAPQRARSAAFAAAVRLWLAARPEPVERTAAAAATDAVAYGEPPAAAAPPPAGPGAAHEQSAPPEPAPPDARAASWREPERLPARPAAARRPPPPGPVPLVPRSVESPEAPRSSAPAAALPAGAAPAPREEPGTPAEPPPSPAAEAPAPPPAPEQPAPAAPVYAAAPEPVDEPTPELPELAVETGLGGAFYLLNLALYLGLYGDFTRPLEPGIALDPWDLLALLAPRLLDEPARGDPLWPLLARLAGRGAGERPGRGFRPPRAWRAPRDWLAPFDHEGAWRWSAARGTLRIVHPAGFPAVAVPRTRRPPSEQLARELRRLRPLAPEPRRGGLPPEPAAPLARWTARLAAYADARLRVALRLAPGDSLDALLLRRRARVFVTPSHVDVVLRLAELPLEVRVAGLDRTPGWIPAAGRFVALHFE